MQGSSTTVSRLEFFDKEKKPKKMHQTGKNTGWGTGWGKHTDVHQKVYTCIYIYIYTYVCMYALSGCMQYSLKQHYISEYS